MWALLLKPFAALLFVALITYPIRRLIERRMKDGRLKRFLLIRLSEKPGSRNRR